jgi:hypothetical protein
MKRFVVWLASCAALLVCQSSRPRTRTISLEELRDRVAGGWAGQMIGVSYGAPTEFRFNERIITGPIEWKPENVSNALSQDDLYVDMTFAKVLDDHGLEATAEQFGEMFRNSQYALWHANLAARRALKRGIKAPLSGTPRYNVHANDIDFQIESDFIGLMAPGMPAAANRIAERAGRVMNSGDGLYGGMFVSAMYAAAFFENDTRRIVEAGLASIPARSVYGQAIADVLRWSRENPENWQKVWWRVEDKWNRREACPAGARRPFNIDAMLNGAYIAIGLLYGGGDFSQTVEITTRLGQDSDCNPSNAAGILGVALSYQKIPEVWKSGIPAIADRKFAFTDYSFHTIVESTVKRAIRLAEANGGKLEGDRLLIRLQDPQPPKLEQWDDFGTPVERIAVTDPRWAWTGDWETGAGPGRRSGPVRRSSAKGAEASVTFQGTGAIVVGPYSAQGGQADIFLDGKHIATIDAYQDGEKGVKAQESLWHGFDLPPGRHMIRVLVRGEPFGGSQGSEIGIEDLVVYRK